jgi:D-alanine-D-alanine ligase
LNVALTYNIKLENFDSASHKNPLLKKFNYSSEISVDTFAEWDTEETIFAVRDALATNHSVTLIEADNDAFEKFIQLKPDIVFNIAEGFNGISREAQIPAMLEFLNIPYTGSDPVTLSICLDKSRTKEILSYHGIPNSSFKVFNEPLVDNHIGLNFPLIVKPIAEGSSKGIFESSLVHNFEELNCEISRIVHDYGEAALVEEFLSGREFTVAILGNNEDLEVLPLIELKHDVFPEGTLPLYSYEAKWILDTRDAPLDVFDCPAKLPYDLYHKIVEISLKTYNILRCRDWARIDIRLDSNNIPNIIEVNPLPGILPNIADNSCFPKAARVAGINYNQMINSVLNTARKRYRI